MKYLLHHLSAHEQVRIIVRGRAIHPNLFEVSTHPRIPLPMFQLGDKQALIRQAIQQAQVAMATSLHQRAEELAQASPKGHMVVLVSQNPTCLVSDKPPAPIYDPPAEWDEEKDEEVVPEGAVVVGYTEAAVGWYFRTTLGLVGVPELPEGFTKESIFETFPFWVLERDIPYDIGAYFLTAKIRAKLSDRFSASLGYGACPPGGKTLAQIISKE
jgi:hypothetical protein